MEKTYNPQAIEPKWYQFWMEKGLFNTEVNPQKTPYAIVMPPPNLTGILHMGHVLNNTLQDIIIRYKRMKGFETLWLPGTDHAGIATQNVVERELAKQGKTRYDIGRYELIKAIWQWIEEKGGRITEQLKKLGASCDWRRQRFTMDEGLSRAVIEVFIQLYKKGLIYRGNYIINWCPRCETALSDDEVEYEEEDGHLWYIKYPLQDTKDEYITVATTRPETMLGDTAVAVNPKDSRYKHLIGRTAIVPLVERPVPIIADEYVDREFGTGCVKVTPAHDRNDFEIGERHKLPKILIMDEKATMNENAGPEYEGMNRFEAREKIVEDLKENNLLEKIEKHIHSIGHCYRCHTVVEPYLSLQWFLKMKPLAAPAIEAVKRGKIKFHPQRWEKVYYNWMENIHDWCISRQIWWGHCIPVYYCDSCGEMIVAREKPEKCPKCSNTALHQDPDVLDTWFSSWLWPFSTLGWPEKTKELEYFYPTAQLITDPGIIFLWVARMIMSGLEFMHEIPFKNVYLHGVVLDERSRKMSKSLGNSPDPIDIINEFGADALRFSMVYNAPKGGDVVYSNALVETGRNFANKVWNAARFAITNAEKINGMPESPAELKVTLADRWVLHELQTTILEVGPGYEDYRFNDIAHILYNFFWNEYCAWYLELIKDRFYNSKDIASQRTAKFVMLRVMDYSLRMLHPIMPFITEDLWQRIKTFCPELSQDSIMSVEFPVANTEQLFPEAAQDMQLIIDIISAVRSIRKDMNVPPKNRIDLMLNVPEPQDRKTLNEHAHYIKIMASCADIKIADRITRPPQSASAVVNNIEIFIPLVDLIDISKEQKKLEKQLHHSEHNLGVTKQKLQNENFLKNAPNSVVEKEKLKKTELEKRVQKLKENLSFLS